MYPNILQKGAQKRLCPLAHMFKANQVQDIIYIYNDIETLALAKEQYGFSKLSENPQGSGQPKWQNPSSHKY